MGGNWVKGNFLPGRSFADDADLAVQAARWQEGANTRPNAARVARTARVQEEACKGGKLPATAHDYGLFVPGRVSPEALVAVLGNRYSVMGAPDSIEAYAASTISRGRRCERPLVRGS